MGTRIVDFGDHGCLTQNSQAQVSTINHEDPTEEQNVDATTDDFLYTHDSDVDDDEVIEANRRKEHFRNRQSIPDREENLDEAGSSNVVHKTTEIESDDDDDDDDEDASSDSSEDIEDSEDRLQIPSDDPGQYSSDMSEDESHNQDAACRRKSADLWHDPKQQDVWFEVGMKFSNVAEFKAACFKYMVQKGCQLHWNKNEPRRQSVVCQGKGCKWRLFASLDGNDRTFKVKTLYRKHACTPALQGKIITGRVLAEHHRNRIKANPRIRISELVRLTSLELLVDVSRAKCSYARKLICREIKDQNIKEFKQLRGYCEELLRLSPGSNIKLQVSRENPDSKPQFKRVYVCLEGCRKGFLLGCRQVIGVDACFLKGHFKGSLLAAVGRDGNNQMFPIAWAVVEGENTDSWRWLFENLADDLNNHTGQGLTFISDKHPGLINARQTVFQEASHRYCARHIYANWGKIFRGDEYKKGFWIAARSTFEGQFVTNMEKIRGMSQGAYDLLMEIPPQFWCRAFFSSIPKCDVIDNNMNETFNSWILDARHLSIIQLLEAIRIMVMKRMAEKKEDVRKWKGDIAPRIVDKLKKVKEESFKCRVEFNGENHFDVWEFNHHFVVNIKERHCSCRVWDITGIPCSHAYCAINYRDLKVEDFVCNWYKKEKYILAYNVPIMPCNGELFWLNFVGEELEPPPMKNKPGRPKVNRRKAKDEPQKVSKGKLERLSKTGVKITCSICKEQGHNKSGCPNKTPSDQPDNAEGEKRKRNPTCGICKQPGHNRTTCLARYMNADDNEAPSQGGNKRRRLGIYINVPSEEQPTIREDPEIRTNHPSQFHRSGNNRPSKGNLSTAG